MSSEQNKQSMTVKEIQDLMRLVKKLELSEFKMKDGNFQLSIRSKHFDYAQASKMAPPQVVQVPATPIQPATQGPAAQVPEPAGEQKAPLAKGQKEEEKKEDETGYVEVKSPIVGTFYRSPSPDKPVYVKVGDTIEVGTVVCIVEAMKLFNEIESEVAGKIVKVVVEDASPVEYDQVLFLVDPNG